MCLYGARNLEAQIEARVPQGNGEVWKRLRCAQCVTI